MAMSCHDTVKRNCLEAEVKVASLALKAFPRNEIGLVPEWVRISPEYRAAKLRFDTAFHCLRAFNAVKAKNR